MKVLSSLKSAKKRHLHCKVVRRKGRIYVINKSFSIYFTKTKRIHPDNHLNFRS